ncbi:hypothetical protein CMUS01_15033 [Colletotrichum musicola]|uniref:Uncharacterized protein n=1 Tax=Colletotrichum musicola TaxID=2175873 RepID=A0A8H6J025_9PEZI|nr:hypothetical protein CMUS01_15033 [Colletotrichum musicola]
MQGGLAATLTFFPPVPPQRAARPPRRNALVAPSAPPPPPQPYQDAEIPEFRSPWPRQPPHVPGGRPDISRRCPHDLVYPCFCRNVTDVPGFVCFTCRAPLCAYNELLQRGTSQELQLELDREVARDRNARQFEQEIRWALEAALRREWEYNGTGPGPYSNGN